MIDPFNIKRWWDQTSQPLKERRTLLPFGQYEDGSVGLAWPALVAAPFEGMANFGRYGYDTPEAIRDNAASAFDVAGGAVTGGLGVGLAGGMVDNAVGSAGGKLTNPQGIRAYHGSPHDFDRFSLDKIGTGEGAQAYGHGLYFADSEDVARSYRDNLLGRGTIMSGKADSLPDRWQMAVFEAMKRPAGEIRDNAIDTLRAQVPAEYADQINALLDNKGRMYEVNIKAKPEDFLDWDKPFSSADDVERFAARFDSVDPQLRKRLEDYAYYRQQAGQPMPDGNDIIREIMGGAGTLDARRASQVMREAGIPGIKYLDGMSRGAGEGSSNYVVFDDQLIDILRKYANAPTGSLPGLTAQTQDDQNIPLLRQLYGYADDGSVFDDDLPVLRPLPK